VGFIENRIVIIAEVFVYFVRTAESTFADSVATNSSLRHHQRRRRSLQGELVEVKGWRVIGHDEFNLNEMGTLRLRLSGG